MIKRSKLTLFQQCRSCYNHLGGSLATAFFASLFDHEYVKFIGKENFDNPHQKLPVVVTPGGVTFFESIGIFLPTNTQACACLDGSERQPHLGGKCGAIVLTFLLEKNIVTKSNQTRTLTCNAKGFKFFEEIFR